MRSDFLGMMMGLAEATKQKGHTRHLPPSQFRRKRMKKKHRHSLQHRKYRGA